MNKKDWSIKESEFMEMEKKQKANLVLVENTLEEISIFLETIRAKIKTFK